MNGDCTVTGKMTEDVIQEDWILGGSLAGLTMKMRKRHNNSYHLVSTVSDPMCLLLYMH